jgi:nucleoside-diphosphate-sugar epimerase/predicted dehydrogenase
MAELGIRRVGFLGAGYIAEFHVRAVRSIPGTALRAICDREETRAQRLASRYGIRGVYTDLATMLAEEQLDVVHVLLPAHLHFSVVEQIVKERIDVFVEKPLCTESALCQELLDRIDEGVRIGVNHNFLYCPVYENLKKDLDAGTLGEVDEVDIVWNKELGQLRSGPSDVWMLREPGNILIEVGPHSFSHLLDLVGAPDWLRVEVGNPIQLASGRRFVLRWRILGEKGSTGIQLRFSFGEGYSEHRIHVRGSLASATVDFERNTYLLHRHGPYALDFDRFHATGREAFGSLAQATRSLASWALTTLKLSHQGTPYQESITRSVRSFYAGLDSELDRRIRASFARDVTELSERIARLGNEGLDRESPVERLEGEGLKKPASVLVLGGTGFIGRELVRRLSEKGYGVRMLSRSSERPAALRDVPLEFVQGNLMDQPSVERALAGIEVVYHLARGNGSTRRQYYDEEYVPTETLANACLERGVKRLIYTSSIAIYYGGKKAGTITEETPGDPGVMRSNIYADSKAECERMLLRMHRERGLPVVITRPGIVIGPGGPPLHPGVAMWHHGSVCELCGKGNTPLPIVTVQDTADGLVRCMEVNDIDGESFNLVGAPIMTANQYIDEVERRAGIRFTRCAKAPWRFFLSDSVKYGVKLLVRAPEPRPPSYRAWEGRRGGAQWDHTRTVQRLGWHPTNDRAVLIREGIHPAVDEFFKRRPE